MPQGKAKIDRARKEAQKNRVASAALKKVVPHFQAPPKPAPKKA